MAIIAVSAITIAVTQTFVMIPLGKLFRTRKLWKVLGQKCTVKFNQFYQKLDDVSSGPCKRIRRQSAGTKSKYGKAVYSNGKRGKRIIYKRCQNLPLTVAEILVKRTPMYCSDNDNVIINRLPITEEYIDLSGPFSQPDKLPPEPEPDPIITYPAINDDSGINDTYWAKTAKQGGRSMKMVKFDHDSYRIGIDSLASACMSPYETDFVPNSFRQVTHKQKVKPYGKGTAIPIVSTGTLNWKVEDDKGRIHTFLIQNFIFIPEGSMRLLSPQHWAKEATTLYNTYERDKYTSTQFWNRNILIWGKHGQYRKTVQNDRYSNVPIFYSASSITQYQAYQAKVEQKVDQTYLTCYPAHYISDVESDAEISVTTSVDNIIPNTIQEDTQDKYPHEHMTDMMSHLEPRAVPVIEEEDEEVITATSTKAELMRWHYRLGHLSFKKIKILAEKGIIPKNLGQVRSPKCAGCIYGKMHKKPWRTKAQPGKIAVTTRAGQCISVDQLESSTVGFIGQMKGKLTTRRYKYATVFVDHFSRYTYVHLQKTLTSEETLEAKNAFEAHCRKHDVIVENYHADNGQFANNLYVQDIRNKGQTITYCGVNAHWQNGIAERMIRTLREGARTQLLHAVERWPSNCSTHLWPFALRYAAQVNNEIPKETGESPLSKFAGVAVQANLNHFHAFGCPVYALNSNLASGKSIGNWNRRARLGIYLGPSPRHARSVSLVMNPSNGLVSPQFHISHDEFFETVDRQTTEPMAPWKTLAGMKGRMMMMQKNIPQQSNPETSIEYQEEIQHDESTHSLQEEVIREMETEATTTEVTTQVEPPRTATSISRVSGRRRTRTQALQDGIDQGLGITSFKSTVDSTENYYEVLHEDDYTLQDQM